EYPSASWSLLSPSWLLLGRANCTATIRHNMLARQLKPTDPCIDYAYRGSESAMTRRYENDSIYLRHQLARRAPLAWLGAPSAGLDAAADRRCSRRHARYRQQVAPLRTYARCRGLAPQKG